MLKKGEKMKKRYYNLIRFKFMCCDSKSLQDVIDNVQGMLGMLHSYRALGVKMELDGACDDYFYFYTEDEKVAEKLGFELDEWGEE